MGTGLLHAEGKDKDFNAEKIRSSGFAHVGREGWGGALSRWTCRRCRAASLGGSASQNDLGTHSELVDPCTRAPGSGPARVHERLHGQGTCRCKRARSGCCRYITQTNCRWPRHPRSSDLATVP